MTAAGTNSPLALCARIGVTLLPYERELEAVFGRPSGYAASIIIDLRRLASDEERLWYEDASDEGSIRALFDGFRHDLHEVGIPWAMSLADLRTLAGLLEGDDHFHHKCLLALVYRDLGRVDDLLKLLADTGVELAEDAAQVERDLGHPPPMWMNEEWNQLATYLRPSLERR